MPKSVVGKLVTTLLLIVVLVLIPKQAERLLALLSSRSVFVRQSYRFAALCAVLSCWRLGVCCSQMPTLLSTGQVEQSHTLWWLETFPQAASMRCFEKCSTLITALRNRICRL